MTEVNTENVFLPPPPSPSTVSDFFPNAKQFFKNHCQPQLISVHRAPWKRVETLTHGTIYCLNLPEKF